MSSSIHLGKLCNRLYVVCDEKITPYSSYKNGACDKGNELDGVSCTVTRHESTLEETLLDLMAWYRDDYHKDMAVDLLDMFDGVTMEMWYRAVCELLCQYGNLSLTPAARYGDG